jgi:hypothetical protein
MDMFSMSYPSTALKFVPGSVYRNLFTTNSEWEFIDATVSSKVYGFGTLPGCGLLFAFPKSKYNFSLTELKHRSKFKQYNLSYPFRNWFFIIFVIKPRSYYYRYYNTTTQSHILYQNNDVPLFMS